MNPRNRSTRLRLLLLALPVALLALQAPALAETQSFSQPYTVNQLNQCTGEFVFLQGEVHLTFFIDQNPDGSFMVREHLNTTGVTGTGLVTGDGYHYSEYDSTRTYVVGTTATTDTYHHIAFIHLGEADDHIPDDRHEYVRVFTTWNNGIPTPVQDVRFECR